MELLKKTDLNAKITKIEGKTPSVTGLATNFALNAGETKTADVNCLVKKADYNTKILYTKKSINYFFRILLQD